jgi:hypothetical protein
LAFALALVAAAGAPTPLTIPAAGFGKTPSITEEVPNGETAGVAHEVIVSLNGVEQLDRLDETHALVRIRVAPGVLNLATAVLP